MAGVCLTMIFQSIAIKEYFRETTVTAFSREGEYGVF